MSFLDDIKKRGKQQQEIEEKVEEIVQKEWKENDDENMSKESKPSLPSPVPLSFLKSIESPITLKKVSQSPTSFSVPSLEPQSSMMDQILKRQQQLKNKEKVESEIVLPKSRKELVVSKEPPKELIDEKEMNEKWSERFFKKSLFLIYLKLDNTKYTVTLCGCCQEKDKLKLEIELEQMKKEFQGYSILNLIKFSSNINLKEYAEQILQSEHFSKYYIWQKDLKMDKYLSFHTWVRSILLCIQTMIITNKKYERNDERFITRLFELLSKSKLKSMILSENSFLFESIKDTRISKILLEYIEKSFDSEEILEISKHKNEKERTILTHAVMNQLKEYVDFFAPYSKDYNFYTLDIALDKVIENPKKTAIQIAKVLIQNNFQTKDYLNIMDLPYFTKEEIQKLYSNSKKDLTKFNDIFLKSINQGNLEILKDLSDQMNKELNYLDHATKSKDGYQVTKYLLSQGFQYNLLNEDLESPIFNACRKGSIEMIELLLEKDLNFLHQKNLYGKTPINIALANGHKKVVKLLKDKYKCELEPCYLHDLSEDVLQYVLSFVSNQSKEFLSCKLSCSFLYNIADSEPLWQLDCLTKYGYTNELVCDSWKVTNYILKSRQLLERFKTSSLKIQPILFSAYHSISDWKMKDPNFFIQSEGKEKSIRAKMLNNRFDYDETWVNDIEKKSKSLNTSSNIAFLPKDIVWKELKPSEFTKELLENEKIEKSYLKMFLKSFTKTSQEFIEQSLQTERLLKEFDHLKLYFGESSNKNGDDFMKQKVSGIKWNHYCIISGDYIAVIQIKQAIKQTSKIDYKTLLKPIK